MRLRLPGPKRGARNDRWDGPRGGRIVAEHPKPGKAGRQRGSAGIDSIRPLHLYSSGVGAEPAPGLRCAVCRVDLADGATDDAVLWRARGLVRRPGAEPDGLPQRRRRHVRTARWAALVLLAAGARPPGRGARIAAAT